MANFTAEDCIRALDVPRETAERLSTHLRLLQLWSPRINLIGPAELEQYWKRHALDCGQLAALAPEARFWLDVGSGAGFPGLIVACVLADKPPGAGPARVTLVESNPKKAAFLREAVRETGVPARVVEAAIEEVASAGPDHPDEDWEIVTARAFAPLWRIIKAAKPILDRGATGLFLKGADYRSEIQAAADQGLSRDVAVLPSLSDPTGRILRIDGATRGDQNR